MRHSINMIPDVLWTHITLTFTVDIKTNSHSCVVNVRAVLEYRASRNHSNSLLPACRRERKTQPPQEMMAEINVTLSSMHGDKLQLSQKIFRFLAFPLMVLTTCKICHMLAFRNKVANRVWKVTQFSEKVIKLTTLWVCVMSGGAGRAAFTTESSAVVWALNSYSY